MSRSAFLLNSLMMRYDTSKIELTCFQLQKGESDSGSEVKDMTGLHHWRYLNLLHSIACGPLVKYPYGYVYCSQYRSIGTNLNLPDVI